MTAKQKPQLTTTTNVKAKCRFLFHDEKKIVKIYVNRFQKLPRTP